jgi:ABC-2 type transport system permease protein
MRYLIIIVVALVVIPLRVIMRRRKQRAELEAEGASPQAVTPSRAYGRVNLHVFERALGDVGTVAAREIRERVRGRIFRVGTLIMLAAVSAAIVIPTLDKHNSSGATKQTVGVVGSLSASTKELIVSSGTQNDDIVKFVPEASTASAKAELRKGTVDFSVINGGEVLLNESASASSSPADPSLVSAVAEDLGVLKSFASAGITDTQAKQVIESRSVPVVTLTRSVKSPSKGTSIVGLILLFFMLSQYNTWILIGVMQEKSSRVVEVLLATVRPIQLLAGKVLGIGLVALGQATLILVCALAVAKGVGSDLLHGSAPLVLVCQLIWLVLGYAFYCWLYAAGGSMAERQDQVQTLALPLSIPILIGYIFSITVASTGNADLLYKVLAYLPPTAPFCMPVLVGLNDVVWWQFVASALISLVGTAGMAVFAARIYRRAVLRTGSRVRARDLLGHTAR